MQVDASPAVAQGLDPHGAEQPAVAKGDEQPAAANDVGANSAAAEKEPIDVDGVEDLAAEHEGPDPELVQQEATSICQAHVLARACARLSARRLNSNGQAAEAVAERLARRVTRLNLDVMVPEPLTPEELIALQAAIKSTSAAMQYVHLRDATPEGRRVVERFMLLAFGPDGCVPGPLPLLLPDGTSIAFNPAGLSSITDGAAAAPLGALAPPGPLASGPAAAAAAAASQAAPELAAAGPAGGSGAGEAGAGLLGEGSISLAVGMGPGPGPLPGPGALPAGTVLATGPLGGAAGQSAFGTGLGPMGLQQPGALGAGALGTGSLGTGALGTGPLGTGPLGTGALGTGALGTGTLGTGALGTGTLGTGALGTGTLGTGTLGTGALGTGALRTGTGPLGGRMTGPGLGVGGASLLVDMEDPERFREMLIRAGPHKVLAFSSACVALLRSTLSPANCFHGMLLGRAAACAALEEAAQLTAIANFGDAVRADRRHFLRLDDGPLLLLVSNSHLQVSDEMEVWQAIADWIAHDPPARQHQLYDLLRGGVRLSCMDPLQLAALQRHPLLAELGPAATLVSAAYATRVLSNVHRSRSSKHRAHSYSGGQGGTGAGQAGHGRGARRLSATSGEGGAAAWPPQPQPPTPSSLLVQQLIGSLQARAAASIRAQQLQQQKAERQTAESAEAGQAGAEVQSGAKPGGPGAPAGDGPGPQQQAPAGPGAGTAGAHRAPPPLSLDAMRSPQVSPQRPQLLVSPGGFSPHGGGGGRSPNPLAAALASVIAQAAAKQGLSRISLGEGGQVSAGAVQAALSAAQKQLHSNPALQEMLRQAKSAIQGQGGGGQGQGGGADEQGQGQEHGAPRLGQLVLPDELLQAQGGPLSARGVRRSGDGQGGALGSARGPWPGAGAAAGAAGAGLAPNSVVLSPALRQAMMAGDPSALQQQMQQQGLAGAPGVPALNPQQLLQIAAAVQKAAASGQAQPPHVRLQLQQLQAALSKHIAHMGPDAPNQPVLVEVQRMLAAAAAAAAAPAGEGGGEGGQAGEGRAQEVQAPAGEGAAVGEGEAAEGGGEVAPASAVLDAARAGEQDAAASEQPTQAAPGQEGGAQGAGTPGAPASVNGAGGEGEGEQGRGVSPAAHSAAEGGEAGGPGGTAAAGLANGDAGGEAASAGKTQAESGADKDATRGEGAQEESDAAGAPLPSPSTVLDSPKTPKSPKSPGRRGKGKGAARPASPTGSAPAAPDDEPIAKRIRKR